MRVGLDVAGRRSVLERSGPKFDGHRLVRLAAQHIPFEESFVQGAVVAVVAVHNRNDRRFAHCGKAEHFQLGVARSTDAVAGAAIVEGCLVERLLRRYLRRAYAHHAGMVDRRVAFSVDEGFRCCPLLAVDTRLPVRCQAATTRFPVAYEQLGTGRISIPQDTIPSGLRPAPTVEAIFYRRYCGCSRRRLHPLRS